MLFYRFTLFASSALCLAATMLVSAPALAQGSGGNGGIFVSEYGANRVRVINATGTSSTTWTSVEKPWGLALDPVNNLYVVEADRNAIGKFSNTGVFLGRTQSAAPINAGNESHGVVGYRQALLLSVDENTTSTPDNLYHYPLSAVPGGAASGVLAPAQTALNNPVLMTLKTPTSTQPALSLVVANQGNNSLSFHNPNNGNVQGTFTDANLNRPHSTAFLGNRMYVANRGSVAGGGNILVYSMSSLTPTFLTSFSSNASNPTDLMFDGNGFLYVTMEGSGNVERYDASGVFQSTFFSGLSTPKSLIINNNGSSQTNPVLPGSVGAGGAFVFNNVATGRWFDPPINPGYDFAMTDTNGFESIDSLPTGFAGGMSVTASNGVLTNTYSGLNPGDAVNFTTFFGAGGVTTFSVNGLSPLTDPGDTSAFPIALSFTSTIASFTMTPQVTVVPETGSGWLACLAAGVSAAGGCVVRRRRAA